MYKTELSTVLETDEKTTMVQYKDCGIEDGKYGQYKKYKSKDSEGNVIYEEKFLAYGGAVYVEIKVVNIDTREQILELYFTKGDKKESISFPRKNLIDGKILDLATYGVQVTKQSAEFLIKSIMNQEIMAPEKNIYKSLGFGEYEGRKIFKGHRAVGIEAEYEGKLDVSPKGSYETYIHMIENEVLGQTPLEFILAVSISGMLVDFLEEKINCENIVVHLVGQSSTGKTTSALLAVASGSSPNFQGNNFVFSFQDTVNSLMHSIPNSYPVVIDEGSLIDKRDMTQTMYSLSSGVEKRRLTKTLDNQEVSRFKTALILTSEKSILAQCNQNSGLLVRNIEIDNVTYTKNAESADTIKSVIGSNYGFVVPKVAELLLEKGKEAVTDMVMKEIESLIQQSKENDEYNNLTERASKQSALILVAVDILKEVLNLDFNKEEIAEFMHEHSLVRDCETVSLGRRAMQHLLQFVTKNYALLKKNNNDYEIIGCMGRLMKVGSKILKTGEISTYQLSMPKEQFEKIMCDGGFSDIKIILNEWRDLQYLQSQKDRYISNIRIINDISVKGYIINLPVQQKDEKKEKPKQKKNQCKEDLSCLDREEIIDFEDKE